MSDPLLSVSRRTRRTHFSARVEAMGVKAYTVYNHMLLPTVFDTVETDYQHLLEHVQIWDVSCERQVEVIGPDATRLVQLMTCRDLSKAVYGQCFYAPLVNEDGGMVNDPIILKLADDRYWLSIADSDVMLWAKGLATGFALNVRVFEPDVSPLAIQGPKADDLMVKVFGEGVRSIRFFRFREMDFRGQSFVVARSGWSKQGGFEIYVERPDLALELWDTLWEAGKIHNIRPGCPNLIERIEGGLFSYGNDMTMEHTPFECGLDKYVNLDGDFEFLGRTALEKAQREGLTRKIRGVRLEGLDCPSCVTPWSVEHNRTTIGEVTSAAYSPRLACGVGFAMVNRGYWDAGTKVTIETPAGVRHASICDIPFE